MPNAVYKYPIAVKDEVIVKMPTGAKILCAQAQDDLLCLWALVDTDEEAGTEDRIIKVFGTGHEVKCAGGKLNYIGTAQMYHGSLVFHVFENVSMEY